MLGSWTPRRACAHDPTRHVVELELEQHSTCIRTRTYCKVIPVRSRASRPVVPASKWAVAYIGSYGTDGTTSRIAVLSTGNGVQPPASHIQYPVSRIPSSFPPSRTSILGQKSTPARPRGRRKGRGRERTCTQASESMALRGRVHMATWTRRRRRWHALPASRSAQHKDISLPKASWTVVDTWLSSNDARARDRTDKDRESRTRGSGTSASSIPQPLSGRIGTKVDASAQVS
ncbi:hypothetical protein L226DRAFT_50556 [Lentinus tigrinus ALCF2SS1-7]|uniref:uncharacterized protein n=1 Tax=Lentinus tigrinus ALCF2SS1-7 TaxID=1328758 RepID=UPI0011661B00|nr:hypothetical protein L226DRAFT_50556 [Lentinus tigrinus ALCF2SS1-7]